MHFSPSRISRPINRYFRSLAKWPFSFYCFSIRLDDRHEFLDPHVYILGSLLDYEVQNTLGSRDLVILLKNRGSALGKFSTLDLLFQLRDLVFQVLVFRLDFSCSYCFFCSSFIFASFCASVQASSIFFGSLFNPFQTLLHDPVQLPRRTSSSLFPILAIIAP